MMRRTQIMLYLHSLVHLLCERKVHLHDDPFAKRASPGRGPAAVHPGRGLASPLAEIVQERREPRHVSAARRVYPQVLDLGPVALNPSFMKKLSTMSLKASNPTMVLAESG